MRGMRTARSPAGCLYTRTYSCHRELLAGLESTGEDILPHSVRAAQPFTLSCLLSTRGATPPSALLLRRAPQRESPTFIILSGTLCAAAVLSVGEFSDCCGRE